MSARNIYLQFSGINKSPVFVTVCPTKFRRGARSAPIKPCLFMYSALPLFRLPCLVAALQLAVGLECLPGESR